ncbi:MAG TPA: hypothetical protein VLB44_06600 [Kofleriaceae bacterium]|nr:hypothetical protein [Kofleriaceae bacterium]
MGALSQARFEELVGAGCTACGARTLEIKSFIDRSVVAMVGDPNDAGRWVHDGEKFVDGTYSIACTSCASEVFAADMCPRCNADGALGKAVGETSRITIPKRCPKCSELELLAVALVPAKAKYGTGDPVKPAPLVEFGEAGYHIVAYACPACDNAVVSERCPLCDAPGPLRKRP